MPDLLSLVRDNARERRARVDLVAEYAMLPMHFLRHLSLDINTWCISVEEEGGGIDLPSMSAIRFDLDWCTFDAPHIPTPCTPPPGATPTARPTA